MIENRQVGARRLEPNPGKVGPYLTSKYVISILRVDDSQHVAGLSLIGVEPQRDQHFLPGLGEPAVALIRKPEVKMPFRMVRSERHGGPECVDCGVRVAVFQIDQPKIEKKVPLLYAEARRLAILRKLFTLSA